MFEITIILMIIVFVELYIIWNLMRKCELIETWIETFTVKVLGIQRQMNEIDSTGHFESDDEIGTIFEGIKELIQDLTNFTEKESMSD